MRLPPLHANWARTSPRAVLTQGAEAPNQVLASSDLPTPPTQIPSRRRGTRDRRPHRVRQPLMRSPSCAVVGHGRATACRDQPPPPRHEDWTASCCSLMLAPPLSSSWSTSPFPPQPAISTDSSCGTSLRRLATNIRTCASSLRHCAHHGRTSHQTVVIVIGDALFPVMRPRRHQRRDPRRRLGGADNGFRSSTSPL